MEINIGIGIITILVTITSWFVIHFLSQKRDFINRKKELRIRYLINVWQLFENAVERLDNDNETAKSLEKAIADIQLFGTPDQIKLGKLIVSEYKKKKKANCLELLKLLRNDLRKELSLEKIKDNNGNDDDIIFFRIK